MKSDGKLNFFENVKYGIVRFEKSLVRFFSTKHSDIYTQFVKKLFLFFILAGILSVLTVFLTLHIARSSSPLTKVPNVKGRSLFEAGEIIQESGLAIEIESMYSDEHKKYDIIDQFPPAGSTVKEGRRLTMIISRGKDLYVVPDLVGMNYKDAEMYLKQNNIYFDVKVIQNEDYDTNVVISQSADPGQELERTVKIDLVVNSDVMVDQYKVKDYSLQNVDVVIRELYGTLRPILIPEFVTNKEREGLIVGQDLKPGAIVPRNTDIRLNVAVYAKEKIDRDNYKYHYFVYYIRTRDILENQYADFGAEEEESAEIPEYADVRVFLSDELENDKEIYSREMKAGERVLVVFKSFGQSVIRMFINGNFVKEVDYE